jgi:uncharacterized paraquat-inducible protein A
MSKQQHIPCPQCRTQIPFDVLELLGGKTVQCPNCKSTIGLGDGEKPDVEEEIEKLEARLAALKQQAGRK